MHLIGILYQSHIQQATDLAERLAQRARDLGHEVWLRSSWEEGLENLDVSATGLIISVGGDGTLLRVTRVAAPSGVPILGVNAGRLGFLTEVEAAHAIDTLPAALDGQGWIEERAMLVLERNGARSYGMNEVVISRGGPARTVQANVWVDDVELVAFRGDGLLVSTATGSTAYNLAAGGPVLPPTAPQLIVKPVSAHPVSESAVLVEPASTIRVRVKTDHGAVLSVDGQDDYQVLNGDELLIRRSPYPARFLRLQPDGYFYGRLRDLLNGRKRHPDVAGAWDVDEDATVLERARTS